MFPPLWFSPVALRVLQKRRHVLKSEAELCVELFTLSREAHFVSSRPSSNDNSQAEGVSSTTGPPEALERADEESNQYENDKILLTDVPELANEEMIRLYAQAVSKVSVANVDVNRDFGRALVSFMGPIGMC